MVIIGSDAQRGADVPDIRQGEDGIARKTQWYVCANQKDPEHLFDDIDSVLLRALRWPSLFYQCFLYISSVKTWSQKRPYVFVRGKGPAARLAARAAGWAAGDVVQVHDDPAGRLSRTRYQLRDDGSLKLLG
ncbi:MAG: hypothetical protein AAFN50_10865 [Pseudomonadota bacterium]